MNGFFPARRWAGWFSNQNGWRALESRGPLRTHVTTLLNKCVLGNSFESFSVHYQGNIWKAMHFDFETVKEEKKQTKADTDLEDAEKIF